MSLSGIKSETMSAEKELRPDGATATATLVQSHAEGQVFSEPNEVVHHNTAVYNHAIEELGFGPYQYGLFLTCGFGFLADQMLAVSVGLVLPQIMKQWDVQYPSMLIAALYAGALVGAILCGYAVDYIGRKIVWQISLFVVSVFTMIAASSPNFAALGVFIGIQMIGAGGNLAIDLTVFTEALPRSKSYLLTALALWWGVGNAVGGLLAWPLIVNFSCAQDATPETCNNRDNMGWRYQYILIGGLTLAMAIIRVLCLQMEESPKWLVSQGRFTEAIHALGEIARKNKKPLNITEDDFMTRSSTSALPVAEQGRDLVVHLKGLFATPKLRNSTLGLIALWMCIGIAYPIFTLFLPIYLANNGARIGGGSTYKTYRDYSISSTVGIFGPILSAGLVNIGFLGRRRTMTATALCAAAFAGAFTTVRNDAQNLAFSSMLGFWQNAFYAVLYAYTPEVMPTAHRGTGCGLTLALARLASLSSPFIATYADLTTSAPIWVCLGLYVAIAGIALCLPFEPKHLLDDERP